MNNLNSKKPIKPLFKLKSWLFLLIFSLILSLSSCHAADIDDFATAINQEDYTKAYNIFLEDDNNEEDYLKIIKDKLTSLEKSYADEVISYDQAIYKIDELALGEEFYPVVKEELEKSKQRLLGHSEKDIAMASAEKFKDSGDYTKSLDIYNSLIEKLPEDEEVKSKKDEVLAEYLDKTIKSVRDLLDKDLPITAIEQIDEALKYSDNAELKTLKSTAKDLSDKKEEEFVLKLVDNEFSKHIANNNFAGAGNLIEKLKSHDIDTTEFETKLNDAIDTYIQSVLNKADELVSNLGGGHWEKNPYEEAISVLDTALEKFPNNESLSNKRAELDNKVPDNIVDNVYEPSEKVTTNASGDNASGYTYTSDAYNAAIYMQPDSSFKFDTGEFSKFRILLSPQSARPNYYSNYVFTIKINDEVVYQDNPFADNTEAVLFDYKDVANSTVTVKVQQSGFASFFEEVLNLNGVYLEAFRY